MSTNKAGMSSALGNEGTGSGTGQKTLINVRVDFDEVIEEVY